jgi:hypothetical protein
MCSREGNGMDVSLDRLRRGISFLKVYAGLMTVLVVILFIKVFLPSTRLPAS